METEPALTIQLSDNEVERLVQEPFSLLKFECMGQFVERAVKTTTEAAGPVTGTDRQDGENLNMAEARKKHPA